MNQTSPGIDLRSSHAYHITSRLVAEVATSLLFTWMTTI